ncbi:hypothetical protein [Clostridium cylindrosporum]|uniref:Uncharacterized protein n=1 Tax=Clostridium cylindrosporum DSM 605 TaxID=1121307 RepID=A0A0J8G5Q9_CLOCY|nr:hypothetical protein [Clostridium cylindrosporum]KMT22976.1 hypothetical protein CLCY_7c00230 [Clostridium cylindrosporum DSM 605]
MEKLKEKAEKAWEYLKAHGIHTEAELDKALKEMKLDIGIFVSPIKLDNKTA